MRIFSPIINPTFDLLTLGIPNDFHRCAVGPKPICHEKNWTAVPFHRFAEEPKYSLYIPPFRGKNFKYLAFVIERTPKVIRLAVDANEHLVQVPAPVGI